MLHSITHTKGTWWPVLQLCINVTHITTEIIGACVCFLTLRSFACVWHGLKHHCIFSACPLNIFSRDYGSAFLSTIYKMSDLFNAGITSNAIYQTTWAFKSRKPHSAHSTMMLSLHEECQFHLKFNKLLQVHSSQRILKLNTEKERKAAAWWLKDVSEMQHHHDKRDNNTASLFFFSLVWENVTDRLPPNLLSTMTARGRCHMKLNKQCSPTVI